MKPVTYWITQIIRLGVGALFIFSGFVKAIDPLGTSYKIEEYFVELGLAFLEPMSLTFSIVMIVFEILLGIALLLGYRAKLTMWLLFLMILFFTFLTGFTYLSGFDISWSNFYKPWTWVFYETNMKVTDCGCFGDFLPLHPKQSFFKDVVLTGLIVWLMWFKKYIERLLPTFTNNIIIGVSTISFFIYCFSNFWWGLPQVDFRPYAVGESILKNMESTPDKLEMTYYYVNKGTGEEQAFIFPDKPKNRDEWDYARDEKGEIKRIDKVLEAGIKARISNFKVENDKGELMDDEILYNSDYSFMVVAYELDHTKVKVFEEKLNALALKADEAGQAFFALTASSNIDEFRHDVQAAYPFYSGDGTFLKTIIRSNPGLLLLKGDTVKGKWHHTDIPEYDYIKQNFMK